MLKLGYTQRSGVSAALVIELACVRNMKERVSNKKLYACLLFLSLANKKPDITYHTCHNRCDCGDSSLKISVFSVDRAESGGYGVKECSCKVSHTTREEDTLLPWSFSHDSSKT